MGAKLRDIKLLLTAGTVQEYLTSNNYVTEVYFNDENGDATHSSRNVPDYIFEKKTNKSLLVEDVWAMSEMGKSVYSGSVMLS